MPGCRKTVHNGAPDFFILDSGVIGDFAADEAAGRPHTALGAGGPAVGL